MTETTTTTTDPTRAYVRALRDFYQHLAIYLVVNVMLFVIDAVTPGGPWFYWPLLFWGIAVAINGVTVLMSWRVLGADWEERKVNELRQRAAHAGRA